MTIKLSEQFCIKIKYYILISPKGLESLTVSSSETMVVFSVVFVLMESAGSMGQLLARPTICPWIAVPSTVPSTSTVIPDGIPTVVGSAHLAQKQALYNNHEKHSTYDRRLQSRALSGRC